jgi:hypothetical protein
VLTQAVWKAALRDILEVKPIPRLRFALATMSSEELKTACVRLATQERLFTADSPRPLQNLFESDVSLHSIPVPVPGGDHFVIISSTRRKLMLYSSVDSTYQKVGLLIPKSDSIISQWTMVAISVDEVMVLIAGVMGLGPSTR